MQNLFNLLFVCVLFTIASCGEDIPECETDFAGTYTGTKNCHLGMYSSIVINLVEVVITGADGNYKVNDDLALQKDCRLTIDKALFGIGTVETVTISEDTLTFSSEGLFCNCIFIGTK